MKVSMLSIDELIPTQCHIRNFDLVLSMIDFVREGGLFRKENLITPAPLIGISIFEDGLKYIRDGHHRTLAIWLAGRKLLKEGEYQLENFKYSHFEEINLEKGWVTPFNPRAEVRIADFSSFKKSLSKDPTLVIDQIVNAREQKQYFHERKCCHIAHICSSCLFPNCRFTNRKFAV